MKAIDFFIQQLTKAKSSSKRFTIIIVFIYLITLISALYLVSMVGKELYTNRELEFKMHSINAMNSIRAQFFERQADIKAFSLNETLRSPIHRPSQKNLRSALKTLEKLHSIYLVYPLTAVTDTQGNIIYQYQSSKERILTFRENNLHLEKSIKLNSDIFFSDFSKHTELPNEVENFYRFQKFISPFLSDENQIAGYIINYADDFYLRRELLFLNNYFRQLGLADIDISITKHDQTVILGYCDGILTTQCEVDHTLIKSNSGISETDKDLVAWQKLEDNRLKSNPNWTVVLKVKKHVYFSSINRLFLLSIVATFLLVTICFISIVFTQRRKTTTEKLIRKKIIETQEFERQRIAREIHDELGQNLTAIKFHLETSPDDSMTSLQNKLSEVKCIVDYTNESVRRISHELHPSLIKNLGLIPAIHWMSERTLDRKNKKYELNISTEDQHKLSILPIEFQSHLYRIYQEAVTNFQKHSNGSLFSASFVDTGKNLKILLEDNGRLPIANTKRSTSGLGLHTIDERVKLLNGDVRFGAKSSLGGFSIEIRIPW